MKKIKFESDNGYVIEFRDDPSFAYVLERLDDGAGGEAHTVKIPGRDGKKHYNLTRTERNITLDCAIISRGGGSKGAMEKVRAENNDYAARSFDPGYFGTLFYCAYDGDPGKKIRCRPTGSPAFEPPFNNLVKFRLGFESADAFWESVTPLTGSLGMVRNHLRFPRFTGVPSAFSFVSARAVIHNPTLYHLAPVVTVYNSDTPVRVENISTGASLKFKVATGKNRRMVIDVKNAAAVLEEYTGNRWAYKENVIHYLTLDSRLSAFVIAPGENEFKLIEMSGQSKPILTITAHEPVIGV